MSDTFSNENGLSAPPKSWVITPLGEIVDFEYGKSLPELKRDHSGSIPVYGSSGVVGAHSIALVDTPCIIVGRKGGAGEVYICKTPCYPIDTTYFIRPSDNLDLSFLFFLLKSLKLGRFDRSTAIPGLNRNDAYKLTIPLPPLKEQNRIVTKIEELFTQLDAGVDSLKKVQIQLKRYRQAVLKAAFEGKLTQGWREHHTGLTVKTNEKFSNDAGGTTFNIPNEWVWINLGLVIESMKNGIYKLPQFYADDGIACLRMYNIENGKIVWKDIKRMTLSEKESDTYLLTEGDLLVNRVNSRELVGKAAVIPCNLEKCVYESKNIRMRFYKNMIDSKLVNYWFLHYAQTYFDKNAQQTVGMASINQHQLSIMPFPLCDILEQKIIIEEIERNFSIADEVVQVIQVSLKQAESLKQSILKRAFEGKLVPQDPTDEPASVLLDRIEEEKAKNNSTAKSGKAIKPLNLRGKV